MQSSTASPATTSTAPSNTTKSKEQILIQSSGAMIAAIVIGIIIILAILLIILKTYNRRTHVSRVLGASGGSKPRQKMTQTTGQRSVPLSTMGVASVSGGLNNYNLTSGTSFRLPRAELSSVEENHIEQFSTTSGSIAVTIHDIRSVENT